MQLRLKHLHGNGATCSSEVTHSHACIRNTKCHGLDTNHRIATHISLSLSFSIPFYLSIYIYLSIDINLYLYVTVYSELRAQMLERYPNAKRVRPAAVCVCHSLS